MRSARAAMVSLLIAAVAAIPISSTRALASSAIVSGRGTASIDGVIGPGEWDNAGVAVFDLVSSAERHRTTLRVMNDDRYLFIAIVIEDEDYKPSRFGDQGDILTLFFDNDGDARIAWQSVAGDDMVQVQIAGDAALTSWLIAVRCATIAP